MNIEKTKHDTSNNYGKDAYTDEALKIISKLENALETERNIEFLHNETGTSKNILYKRLDEISGKNSSEYVYESRYRVRKKLGEDIGLKNAKKGLIQLLFSHSNVINSLKKHLSAEEMGGGVFSRLLELAFTNPDITPTNIIDLFENNDDQQLIAEIFADIKEFPDEPAIEKALTDMTKKIKLSWLNMQMDLEKNDLNAVKSLHFRSKSINSLNISLNDG
jgi:hypothetical protein